MVTVNFKGVSIKVVIEHPSFRDPKDPYTDSQVESGAWPNGVALTDDECEAVTDQMRADGSMTDDWTASMPDYDEPDEPISNGITCRKCRGEGCRACGGRGGWMEP